MLNRIAAILMTLMGISMSAQEPRINTDTLPIHPAPQIEGRNLYLAFYGSVDDAVQKQLAKDWDDTNPNQLERAYCVSLYAVYRSPYVADSEYPGFNILVRVIRVTRAKIHGATVDGIEDIDCPPGTPELHVHTPATCYDDGCRIGGSQAYDTDPSREDLVRLRSRNLPFGIIQLDRHTFRFYYQWDFRMTVPAPKIKQGMFFATPPASAKP